MLSYTQIDDHSNLNEPADIVGIHLTKKMLLIRLLSPLTTIRLSYPKQSDSCSAVLFQ